MSKMDSLQDALNSTTSRRPPQPAVKKEAIPTPQPENPAVGNKPVLVSNSREGKDNIAGWLPPGYKRSIRLVQAKRPDDPSLQDLMAEAFNDLFTKYNVPTVSE